MLLTLMIESKAHVGDRIKLLSHRQADDEAELRQNASRHLRHIFQSFKALSKYVRNFLETQDPT